MSTSPPGRSAFPSDDPGDDRPGPEDGETDPTVLLIQALNGLDAADRDRVYAWLLRRTRPLQIGGWSAEQPIPVPVSELTRSAFNLGQQRFTQSMRATISTGQQMVPVRFSSEQHSQLREWCAEHGFSMATVIRGLVARFLESQSPDSAQPA